MTSGSNDNILLRKLVSRINIDIRNTYEDNFDHLRFRSESCNNERQGWRAFVDRRLARRGYMRLESISELLQSFVSRLAPLSVRFNRLYHRLDDEESRNLLVALLAFRCLGHRCVRLPLSTPEYWKGCRRMESLADMNDCLDPKFLGWKLPRIDLSSLGMPISIYLTPKNAYTQFVLEQYRCATEDCGNVEARQNDCVIDCGGCWGDTSLYFAHRVGPNGMVKCFEFLPSNLEILEKNVEMNPDVRNRIHIVPNAVWNESDLAVSYRDDGPASRINIGAKDTNPDSTTTLSIDDLVARENLTNVDFIKMDIEGAELNALRGATQTLKRHRPKIAVAVYHSLDDFVDVPEFIDETVPGYQFYLRHFTIHHEETILFAAPRDRVSK